MKDKKCLSFYCFREKPGAPKFCPSCYRLLIQKRPALEEGVTIIDVPWKENWAQDCVLWYEGDGLVKDHFLLLGDFLVTAWIHKPPLVRDDIKALRAVNGQPSDIWRLMVVENAFALDFNNVDVTIYARHLWGLSTNVRISYNNLPAKEDTGTVASVVIPTQRETVDLQTSLTIPEVTISREQTGTLLRSRLTWAEEKFEVVQRSILVRPRGSLSCEEVERIRLQERELELELDLTKAREEVEAQDSSLRLLKAKAEGMEEALTKVRIKRARKE